MKLLIALFMVVFSVSTWAQACEQIVFTRKSTLEERVCFDNSANVNPGNLKTSWLSLRFYSLGAFSQTPYSHVAFSLQSHVRYPIQGSSLVGAGVILGHTHLIPHVGEQGGCLAYANAKDGIRRAFAQIELWEPNGNSAVYHTTCYPHSGLNDFTWYTLTIEIVGSRLISFWINDDVGLRLDPDITPSLNIPQELRNILRLQSGIAMAFVPGPESLDVSNDWLFFVKDVQYGWK